jgi:tetratricopeptide (TPR) repeat protein
MRINTLFFLIFIVFLVSCNDGPYDIYISKENPDREELLQMFPLLETSYGSWENRYTLMGKILRNMISIETPGVINLFVNDYIKKNPDDPYNAYYLSILALSFLNNGATEFARPILNKVVTNYKDLNVNGLSVHFSALVKLTEITPSSREKVKYYNLLIKEHPSKIENLGLWYYNLAKTYEDIEMWDESIDAYSSFLKYPEAIIPGNRDAREQVKDRVNFYFSNKKWVVKDLDKLVSSIKWALSVKDSVVLDRYRAQNFFITNWKSTQTDIEEAVVITSKQLVAMTLRVSPALDKFSNENEAYLEVSGARWSSSIWSVYPSWFFYFRRIYYPMDPEIHGGWEWAGIYLGERL